MYECRLMHMVHHQSSYLGILKHTERSKALRVYNKKSSYVAREGILLQQMLFLFINYVKSIKKKKLNRTNNFKSITIHLSIRCEQSNLLHGSIVYRDEGAKLK